VQLRGAVREDVVGLGSCASSRLGATVTRDGGRGMFLVIWLLRIWPPRYRYTFSLTPLWAGIYLLPLIGRPTASVDVIQAGQAVLSVAGPPQAELVAVKINHLTDLPFVQPSAPINTIRARLATLASIVPARVYHSRFDRSPRPSFNGGSRIQDPNHMSVI
jgi:hypothetical protein